MPAVGVLGTPLAVSAHSHARCALYKSLTPVRVPHTIAQSQRSKQTSLWTASASRGRRDCISCTAQKTSQQEPTELVTPEIVTDDEQCDLPAPRQSAAVQSNTKGLAPWLRAGLERKVTALLGFAGLSAAALIGTVCPWYQAVRQCCKP